MTPYKQIDINDYIDIKRNNEIWGITDDVKIFNLQNRIIGELYSLFNFQIEEILYLNL